MELIKYFAPEQFAAGLESWGWIGLDGKAPVFASVFGDVLLRAADGLWWLDTLQGELTRPWQSTEEVEAALNTADGQEHYLLAGLARAAWERGLVPADGEVYDFTHPPVLGGELDPDNLGVIDFATGLNIAGQIHDQVRDLPPGTPITFA
ncbi:T6SS immunity protein Tdi1 domain-containing protein [Actinomadura macrotermitis]|nr:T6SS immunity protein Tdi1 domain-containing protein [Actinomadura macrotermitis]